MLEIIGYIGCAYLLVKALELAAKRDTGSLYAAASMIAGLGAIIFGAVIYFQASDMRRQTETLSSAASDLSPAVVECINNAKTNDEILACSR